jgi:hypothetical protein
MTTLQSLQSKVGIDLSDVMPGIAAANAVIGQGITQATDTAQAGLNKLGGSFDVLSAQETRAEQQAIRTAQAQARAMAAEGDRAGAVRVLTEAQNSARGISEQTNYQIDAQISSLQKGASAATDYGAAFQQGLTNIVGPAAVVTAALGAVVGVANSFKEAFTFDAELGANTKAIEIQLRGVRDSGQAFQEARQYANEFKLTQQETSEAMIASIPVIRNSTSSLEEILGVFDRLQIRQPGKTFQDAARALGELQAGQVVSIEHMFNVPANDANRMKKEIEDGGDAVQVLSKYLTDSGIGMDALKAKTEGAMGALKDYTKAQEDLKIAQGEFAKGPGIAILDTASRTLSGTTRILTGDWIDARKSVQDAILTGVDGMTKWNPVAEAFAHIIGNATGATQAQAAAIADVYTSQQELTELTGRTAGAFQAATKAQSDYTDVSKLTDDQLKSLQKTLEDTATRASDAYAKLGQAQTDYETKSQADAAAQQTKLADMATKYGADLAKIDQTAADARTKATEDWRERTTKITDDGHRRLLELETDYTNDLASKRAAANVRYLAIDTDLTQKIADDRQTSAARIAEIEAGAQADSLTQTQAAADRQASVRAQMGAAAIDSAQKLATFEQSTLDARASAQDAYVQRVTQAQAQAARAQQDQARTDARAQEDAATRAADQAQDRQISAENAAQAHADRLAAIAAQASGSGAVGRTTTLTGGRFTTVSEAATGGSSVADQIAVENAKYQAQLDATARSQALSDSRAARDAATNASRAAEDRALQQQDLAAQAAAQDAAYAAQLAKAQDAAEKQRQALIQAGNDKLAAIQAQAAQADAQADKSDAAADARLQAQIAKERQTQATREADAARAADRAHADLIAATNRDLADRQASYEAARKSAIDATTRQQQDENATYAKQLVTIANRRAADRASTDQEYAAQRTQAIAAYTAQEADRLTAYRKQKTDLETALGEQETAYVKAQEAIGQITHTAALAREQIIAASYGRQAAAQRAAFNAAFGDIANPDPTSTITQFLGPSGGQFAPTGGSPISIGNVTVNGVQNAQQFLDELRGLVTQGVRSNGGDANKYWGGTPQ